MDVAVRADASRLIGSGHVVRCSTLAAELRRRGARVRFVCREHPSNLIDWLRQEGYEVLVLPEPSCAPAAPATDDYAAWLGATEEEDAAQTLAALGRDGVDWLIVDHYGLGAGWERAMRAAARRVFVIDDLPERAHDCDLLLDQNRCGDSTGRRGGARVLAGPAFALLRPAFREARGALRPRNGRVRRILVFFGGSDPSRQTEKALEALAGLGRDDIAIDVIVGQVSERLDAIEALCAGRRNVAVHRNVKNMEALLAAADLALGACGATSWERCCLGLPAIAVSIAENQIAIGRQLAAKRAAIYLGAADTVSGAAWGRALGQVLARPRLLARMAQRGLALADGAGTRRVAAALTGTLAITVVSDAQSWLNAWIGPLATQWRDRGHAVRWIHEPAQVEHGDIAFFLSCGKIAGPEVLARNGNNLVVHESALPKGRGWSPLTWQVLEGASAIAVTLFEAAAELDSGPIYLQQTLALDGHELVDELRLKQAAATVSLCNAFLDRYPEIAATGRAQRGEPSYYRRRRPEDSRLDATLPLESQFDLLRVVDNDRYPAFFDVRGHRYILRVSKSAEGPT